MDLGVFDAWAGLLISHPHHQLSAAPSVSQITEFVVVVWPEDEKGGWGGGFNFSKWSFLLTSSTSAHILVLIRLWENRSDQQVCVCVCKRAVLHMYHDSVFVCVIYRLFCVLWANPQSGEAAALQPGGPHAPVQPSDGALAPVIREVILCHKSVRQCVFVYGRLKKTIYFA